jgi:ferredoxin
VPPAPLSESKIEAMIEVSIDGRTAQVPEGVTIVLAAAAAGIPLTANVGCMGQGVCGACRALVREEGSNEVRSVLACETRVEPGMRVSFLDRFSPRHPHAYEDADIADGWSWVRRRPSSTSASCATSAPPPARRRSRRTTSASSPAAPLRRAASVRWTCCAGCTRWSRAP